jgi:hypothetical protein
MPKPASLQKRVVIITALALTAMAVPLATAAMGLAAALSPATHVDTQQAREKHQAKALEEYLRSRLEAPQGWQDWVSATAGTSLGLEPTPAPAPVPPAAAAAPPEDPVATPSPGRRQAKDQ